MTNPSVALARSVAASVCDPEIPVLTLDDLGVLRAVRVGSDGVVDVEITPTYSGCPALEVIRTDVERALHARGFSSVRVHTVLSPAWTTDWMSAEGKRKLREYGIAPPGACDSHQPLVACPQCGSTHTSEITHFGSTPCKALRRCGGCREPFDHFKPH